MSSQTLHTGTGKTSGSTTGTPTPHKRFRNRRLPGAGTVGRYTALAVAAALTLEVRCVAELRQVAEIARRDQGHIAAVPAVTAVRSATRHVLLAPEADAAVAAATALHVDRGAVGEHRSEGPPTRRARGC